jgi:hypothetical protein
LLLNSEWQITFNNEWWIKSIHIIFISITSSSLNHHSLFIRQLTSDELKSFLSQCFWFEKSKKWRMNIIQILSWISDEKILIEDLCQKTSNDDFLSQWWQLSVERLLWWLSLSEWWWSSLNKQQQSFHYFLNSFFTIFTNVRCLIIKLLQCCRIVWWLVFMWCSEEIVCCMYEWRLNDDDFSQWMTVIFSQSMMTTLWKTSMMILSQWMMTIFSQQTTTIFFTIFSILSLQSSLM